MYLIKDSARFCSGKIAEEGDEEKEGDGEKEKEMEKSHQMMGNFLLSILNPEGKMRGILNVMLLPSSSSSPDRRLLLLPHSNQECQRSPDL